ncbi:MAG TPA: hypothetical protein VE033_03900 [Acetobacteraceae bacterium]|jgi:hypothetical protein|nr:hypothetical protein [Acetobacteraceae bacterium]
MTTAERLHGWNAAYERIPETQRFWVLVWGLIAIGAINMWLTIAIGFPFALLLVFALLAAAAIRLPRTLGWLSEPQAGSAPRMEIHAPWIVDLNQRYEALPELRRPFVPLAILVVAGAINMWLTAAFGFPFAFLFLLAVLALIIIRLPWVNGWVKPDAGMSNPALSSSAPGRIELASPAPMLHGQDAASPQPEPRSST